jgi:hypothetical protein
MIVHIHLITSTSGGSGKSLMSYCALSHFAELVHENKNQNENVQVYMIDANSINHDIYDVWLKDFSFRESQSMPNVESYVLYNQNNKYIETIRISNLNWEWLYQFLQLLSDKNENANSIIYLIIDTNDSGKTALEDFNLLRIEDTLTKMKLCIFPWLIWTTNIFSNISFFSNMKRILKECQPSGEQPLSFLPIHVFNPILSDSELDQGGILSRLTRSKAQEERIESYNRYRIKLAGEYISIDTFFDFAAMYFLHTIRLGNKEKEVHENLGEVLLNTFTTDKKCKSNDKLCRYANIFCISTYDRNIGDLKTVPTTIERIATSAINYGKSSITLTPPIVMLKKVLGRVALEVSENINALYDIHNKENLTK